MNLSRRWRCCDCTKITDHLLSAPDPFTVGEELHACPHCRSVMGVQFAALCDEPGCTETVTDGWGNPQRWTCSYHRTPRARCATADTLTAPWRAAIGPIHPDDPDTIPKETK